MAQAGTKPDRRRHRGAGVTAAVLRIIALIVLIGGGVAATDTYRTLGPSYRGRVAVEVGIGAGALFVAATIWWFGSVLRLLREIAQHSDATPSQTLLPEEAGTRSNDQGEANDSPADEGWADDFFSQTFPATAPSPPPVPDDWVVLSQPPPPPLADHPLPPAGWYGDPQRVARLRFWDGQKWTEDTWL